MKLFVNGSENRLNEFREKIGGAAEVSYFMYDFNPDSMDFSVYDAVFDLNLDDAPENIDWYARLENKPVIVSAAKMQLAQMGYYQGNEIACHLAGFNALPTFINRAKAELSVYNPSSKETVSGLFERLDWAPRFVEDRVGMVTPRLIFMIINEAAYTLQEGIATARDIDESMKLGVNYPYGPFEWCDKIGIIDVYETLQAIYNDTNDERYKICPLLKTRYLRGELFYA